ncbi:PP0621 family protein [Paraburkholderia sp. BCC1885]|uniref:PP0621 family protein n=1 Tax=Paraburkholderia sp. BCC1885 TaxID=2562669 RepID=UPI001183189F|nr:PP0621 family protein [Paraburkholderia sp. BCC1885]
MRQIFLLILMFVVGQWLVKAIRRSEAQNAQRSGAAGGAGASSAAGRPGGGAQARAAKAPQLPEPMIRCVECGVHAPASDSIVVAGEPFCCTAHAQRHATRPTGRDAR